MDRSSEQLEASEGFDMTSVKLEDNLILFAHYSKLIHRLDLDQEDVLDELSDLQSKQQELVPLINEGFSRLEGDAPARVSQLVDEIVQLEQENSSKFMTERERVLRYVSQVNQSKRIKTAYYQESYSGSMGYFIDSQK